jgi:hypothetical protein
MSLVSNAGVTGRAGDHSADRRLHRYAVPEGVTDGSPDVINERRKAALFAQTARKMQLLSVVSLRASGRGAAAMYTIEYYWVRLRRSRRRPYRIARWIIRVAVVLVIAAVVLDKTGIATPDSLVDLAQRF